MRVLWSEVGKRYLGHLEPGRRATVESETETMFTDSVPATAQKMSGGTLFVELPCGMEVIFERIGDGVQIIMLTGTLGEEVAQTERSFVHDLAALD